MAEGGGNPHWDVFLAYASPDRSRARVLYDALVALGVSVGFDQEALDLGDNWYLDLPRHVAGSTIVVALLSASSKKAHFQHSELVAAIQMVRDEDRRLIPVRLSPDAWVPYGTEQLQAGDMFTDDDAPALAGRIAALLPGRASSRVRVVSPRIPRIPKHFTGRDRMVADIQGLLAAGSSVVITQGMGGVGKTTLAAAIAHASDADIVCWIRSETPDLLASDLTDLAPHLGVRDDPVAVRQALASTDRSWLLVFDNAVDGPAIAEWVPAGGSVLVTSRSRDFPEADELVAIEVLPPPEADRFLRARVGGTSEDLTAVIARLDGLPLALEQAAAWVARSPARTFADFGDRFDRHTDGTPTDTWKVSIEAATAEAPRAGQVLSLLGFLAPEPLPTAWLKVLDDPDAVDDALAALHAYSLVTITPAGTLTVHRLIQRAARLTAPPEAAESALEVLYRQTPSEGRDHTTWPTMRTLAPHAAALSGARDLLIAHSETLAWVLVQVAEFQRGSGAVHAAIDTGQLALDVAVTHLASDPDAAQYIRGRLATALQAAGRLAEAVDLFEAVLADHVQRLGSDHPNTLAARNNLASVYADLHDHDRAVLSFEATLIDSLRILGPDHRDTLLARHNVAVAYSDVGDHDRAVALLGATLTDQERILGPDDPDTLRTRQSLARAHIDAGDDDCAFQLLTALLNDQQRVIGHDHPDTLSTRFNVARAYAVAGGYDRAIELFGALLADRKRVLGAEHPHTITTQIALAEVRARAADADGG